MLVTDGVGKERPDRAVRELDRQGLVAQRQRWQFGVAVSVVDVETGCGGRGHAATIVESFA